jgi:hypothetical protein
MMGAIKSESLGDFAGIRTNETKGPKYRAYHVVKAPGKGRKTAGLKSASISNIRTKGRQRDARYHAGELDR